MAPELAGLIVGDAPSTWAALGFVVGEDGVADVGGVRHELRGGGEPGVTGWSWRDIDPEAAAAGIDGLPIGIADGLAVDTPDHPNGVVALDHVVLVTPALSRTIDALERAGVELRRVREAGRGRQQAFFRLGPVILEVVGPAAASSSPPDDEPRPRFYGLAWTVRDLDATAAFLGDRLRPAKDAVQPGRRIATLDRAMGGSTASMAFMSA